MNVWIPFYHIGGKSTQPYASATEFAWFAQAWSLAQPFCLHWPGLLALTSRPQRASCFVCVVLMSSFGHTYYILPRDARLAELYTVLNVQRSAWMRAYYLCTFMCVFACFVLLVRVKYGSLWMVCLLKKKEVNSVCIHSRTCNSVGKMCAQIHVLKRAYI